MTSIKEIKVSYEKLLDILGILQCVFSYSHINDRSHYGSN